ncbi:MAG: hypothetical protein JSV94_01595 [Methanobacteriota archaeon]|nr:MAG: hypothetical protein JSV94_01595 [Euryarchaeota archaeon]
MIITQHPETCFKGQAPAVLGYGGQSILRLLEPDPSDNGKQRPNDKKSALAGQMPAGELRRNRKRKRREGGGSCSDNLGFRRFISFLSEQISARRVMSKIKIYPINKMTI